jgi:short-subunit dehydrogenase involved in D-alanine esterification of teichoic acids
LRCTLATVSSTLAMVTGARWALYSAGRAVLQAASLRRQVRRG